MKTDESNTKLDIISQTTETHILSILSENIREALHSYRTLRMIFYDNKKDIPYTTNLFSPETVLVFHRALFSSVIISIGRLMDKRTNSISIPNAIKILEKYQPNDQHKQDIWKYNLSNWFFDYSKNELTLREPTKTEQDQTLSDYLDGKPKLIESYKKLIELNKPMIKWRNNAIAHSDQKHATSPEILEAIPRESIENFLQHAKHLIEELCGKLYQGSPDTSETFAQVASQEIIDYAYKSQLGDTIAHYIEHHSPDQDQDREIFVQGIHSSWTNEAGSELVKRVLKKREEIKNIILQDNEIVTSHCINHHHLK